MVKAIYDEDFECLGYLTAEVTDPCLNTYLSKPASIVLYVRVYMYVIRVVYIFQGVPQWHDQERQRQTQAYLLQHYLERQETAVGHEEDDEFEEDEDEEGDDVDSVSSVEPSVSPEPTAAEPCTTPLVPESEDTLGHSNPGAEEQMEEEGNTEPAQPTDSCDQREESVESRRSEGQGEAEEVVERSPDPLSLSRSSVDDNVQGDKASVMSVKWPCGACSHVNAPEATR